MELVLLSALSLIISLLIGVIAAMMGIGGGAFLVPALILLFGLEPAQASGTSLAAICFLSISSTIRYAQQKRIDYLIGAILAATSVPSAFLGSYATEFIKGEVLGISLGAFLLFISFRMITPLGRTAKSNEKGWSRRIVDNDGEVFNYRVKASSIPLFGFLSGFFSGLLGIGGGSILVPAMSLVMNIPIHIAIAISMFVMAFSSVTGALTHLQLGHTYLEYIPLLAIGMIIGAQIGTYIAKKVSEKNLKRISAMVLLLISIRIILKFTCYP